jgi:site-specific recombinase XerD
MGFSTHKLRHTAATLMYQYGDVDPLQLKEILGHENLSTTEIYTHVYSEQLREAVNSNPLNKVSKKKKSGE